MSTQAASAAGFLRRLAALTLKEFRQVSRDTSSMLIGVVLPVMLIFIFGYGMSLDVNHVPVAVCMERPTPLARSVLSGLEGSPYFDPVHVSSMREAEELMMKRRVDAILHTADDFDSRYEAGNAQVQAILHGTDSTTATMVQRYAAGVLALHLQSVAERSGAGGAGAGASVTARVWFNEASTSTWYLVPGIIVIVMTMVGAFLTSLVMAREWERGTLESLFTTPAGSVEILISKVIPYFCLGLCGLALCLAASRWLFHVPMRGSLSWIVLASMLYLLVALGMGLVISSVTRNQFLACQISLIASFLPALLLSGFLFDLRSVPAVVRVIGHVLPATYYMDLLKTLFLAGDNPAVLMRNVPVLAGYAVLFLGAALRFTRKRLD